MESSLVDLAKPVLDAIMRGQWAFAAALCLVLCVTAARRYGVRWLPWVGTDAGGAMTALLLSFGGALATALSAGAAPTWAMVWMAAKVAAGAAGAFTLAKKLLVPLLETLRGKAPAWVRPVLDMVLWVFSKPDPIAKAKAAGNAAVKAKPGTGLGPTDEIE